MVEDTDSSQQCELGPLVIRPRSTRNILIDNVAQLSCAVRKTRVRGLSLLDNALQDVLLRQDREKSGYNFWRGGGGIRYIAQRINPGYSLSNPELSYIYERVGGFLANMIFFADAVLDEQKPSTQFVEHFINGCADCVKAPQKLTEYTFPDDSRYLKVKAALICAQEVGKALTDLESWAKRHDKTSEFETCKSAFLQAAERLKEAEITSFTAQQNPFLSVAEYDRITQGKSVNIFYAGVSIIIPLSQDAIAKKEKFLSLSELTTAYIHVQMCDDIEDLADDLPHWFTISSCLHKLDQHQEFKEEFFGLVTATRTLTPIATKSKDIERIIKQMKNRMITILWETGIIPQILKTLGSPNYYKSFRAKSIEILDNKEFNREFRRELKLVLTALSGVQITFSNTLLLKRKLRL
jgi:hypothetical protein